MTIYLASPYKHQTPKVMEDRFKAVTIAAAHFMDKGERIYSPITHGHTVNQHMKQDAGCHKFWLDQCYKHVVTASAVYVLGTKGWDESVGVRWEIETAFAFGVPVYYVDPDDYSLEAIIKDENGFLVEY